jgi:hypothetical protein
LLFIFALEYVIRNIQEIQVGLKLKETHQVLVCAEDETVMVDNIDNIKKYTETLN